MRVFGGLRLALMLFVLLMTFGAMHAAERAELERYDGIHSRLYSSRAAWLQALSDTLPPTNVAEPAAGDSLETAGPDWGETLFNHLDISGAHGRISQHSVRAVHTSEDVDLLYLACKDDGPWRFWPIGCWPTTEGGQGVSGGCDSIQVNIVSVGEHKTPLVVIRQFARQYRAARGVYGTSIETSTQSVQIWDAASARLLLNSIVERTERRSGQIINGAIDPSGMGGAAKLYETLCRTAVFLRLTEEGLVVGACRTDINGDTSENGSNPCQELFFGPRAGTYELTDAGFVLVAAAE